MTNASRMASDRGMRTDQGIAMRFRGMILTATLFVAAPLAVADVAATARDLQEPLMSPP